MGEMSLVHEFLIIEATSIIFPPYHALLQGIPYQEKGSLDLNNTLIHSQ